MISDTAQIKQKTADKYFRFQNSGKFPYGNRELSWMDFNRRVLEEACRTDNPILERCNFLAITSSNLDEFFTVRIAGVIGKARRSINIPDESGFTPEQLLKELDKNIHDFAAKQYYCYNNLLIPQLKSYGIEFLSYDGLSEEQKNFADMYFQKAVLPSLAPEVSPANNRVKTLRLPSGKNLGIAFKLAYDSGEELFTSVQIPAALPRTVRLPSNKGCKLILLEEIIKPHSNALFPRCKIKRLELFRTTRGFDIDFDGKAENPAAQIQRIVYMRNHGAPVRLEIHRKCGSEISSFLSELSGTDKSRIYNQNGPLDLSFLSNLLKLGELENLKFKPIIPVNPPAEFCGYCDIFEAVRKKDRMVHHPYESFDIVGDFIRISAEDSAVIAIKQTLYRVSENSPIASSLIRAAQNGKQVTVLIELKARFDEENNIKWAKKLKQAGCHVIYGIPGLKTHCKICIAVRKENDKIRRYLHIGTGNYNELTAKAYTDAGIFTCREEYGEDASLLFDMLESGSVRDKFKKLIVSPLSMRNFFETKIKLETENALKGYKASITIKINSLVDCRIIKLLYLASNAGVKINLIVRGICCLIPELSGLSENIRVVSVVGQFLEHSRFYIFENRGNPLYYMGSADLMPRNLDKRIETVFPVEDADIKKRIKEIAELMLADTSNARVQHCDASYDFAEKNAENPLSCQKSLAKIAADSQKTAYLSVKNQD